MRLASKIDANQHEIVNALRKAGASDFSLASVGHGCPDLLVGYNGNTILMEIKDGSKPPSKQALTPDQLKFIKNWTGSSICIVNDVEASLRILNLCK
jgi:hypothetical protein